MRLSLVPTTVEKPARLVEGWLFRSANPGLILEELSRHGIDITKTSFFHFSIGYFVVLIGQTQIQPSAVTLPIPASLTTSLRRSMPSRMRKCQPTNGKKCFLSRNVLYGTHQRDYSASLRKMEIEQSISSLRRESSLGTGIGPFLVPASTEE